MENEWENMIRACSKGGNKDLDQATIDDLIRMFNETNEPVNVFRMAMVHFKVADLHDVCIK